jgi:Zn finger protein HypA/HybF involved in hydrogenase expression
MHELSLVDALIVEVRRQVGGAHVERIRVRHATTIPEAVLRQAFGLLAQGDPLADATLEPEPFEIRLACPCGFEGALGHDDVLGPTMAVCPSCAELRRTPRTAELELVEVHTSG